MEYNVTKIRDGVWAIDENTVRMFLVDGGTEALLIDTGFGSGDLKELVSSLVSGEITVINTHCHGDHTSGNRQFTRFVMSREDLDAIRPSCPDGAWIRTVTDGEEITAGSACVKVLAIPGHTPGSIALLDEKDRLLFSSDAVAKHFPVYMQFPGQDVGKYLESLKKMKALRGRYDRICPCHGELDVEPVYLDKMIRCCEGILNRTIRPGTALNSAGAVERAFWFEDVAVFH